LLKSKKESCCKRKAEKFTYYEITFFASGGQGPHGMDSGGPIRPFGPTEGSLTESYQQQIFQKTFV
jgi:hypothetical protein